ncbi:vitamin K epoxide reductase family protein [candidate division WWE3 bacterium]|jgi:uncharacterized membrane protein|nr:vitamin K epoxide reductase family protein [candidate division WWE3 bacterium]MBT7349288.1 vitamin K epoxide reductase family protein [candidate division WWE3 bacterium]
MFTIPVIVFISLALVGLADTLYIVKHTRKDNPLICPIGFECNEVVNSNYATFLGFKNDIIGVLFYIGMLFGGLALIFLPDYYALLTSLFKIATFGAALFSLYLTYIQAFKLKNFCLYCLFSAGSSIGLFITAFYL